MGRIILCGAEAVIPYEAEGTNLCIYTIEELCYYVYNNVPLLTDEFIDDRLVSFIDRELNLKEIADKLRRFYHGPNDMDNALMMLLSEVGYYTDQELTVFQAALSGRRHKSLYERMKDRADELFRQHYYMGALGCYKKLAFNKDGRIPAELKLKVKEAMANCYGRLMAYDPAMELLEQVYDDQPSERLLEKMYDVCMLSGKNLPDLYFKKVPEEKIAAFQQRYWSRETIKKGMVESFPAMQIFLHEPEKSRKELKEYVAFRKKELRKMLG